MARAAVTSPVFTFVGRYPSRPGTWAQITSGQYAGVWHFIEYWRYQDEYNLFTNEMNWWWNGSRAVYWGHYQCGGFGREYGLGCRWFTSWPTNFPY